MVFFGMVGICMLLGFLTEKTSLFGPTYYKDSMDDKERDNVLLRSKSVVGKALMCFSPSRNMNKLFYAPGPPDHDLDILNGVRVISLIWVILGHAYFV